MQCVVQSKSVFLYHHCVLYVAPLYSIFVTLASFTFDFLCACTFSYCASIYCHYSCETYIKKYCTGRQINTKAVKKKKHPVYE